MTPEQIAAWGAVLWKVLLSGGFLISVIAFRKQLGGVLDRLIRLRIRRGETELLAEVPHSERLPSEQEERPLLEKSKPAEVPEIPQLLETKDVGTLRGAMFDALFERRLDDAQAAFRRIQEQEGDPLELTRNEAVYLGIRYRIAPDPSSLSRLRELAGQPETRSVVLSWLAKAHQYARNFQTAEQTYIEAITAATSDQNRASLVAHLVRSVSESGSPARARETAIEHLGELGETARAPVYEAISEVEKALGNEELGALCLEKVCQAKPEDSDALFNAAYALSDAGFHLVATGNYDTLLRFDPENSVAANNLGVEADQMELPIRAVELYRRAADGENTLAMANLAHRLMARGFAKEAESLLKTAAAKPSPHANVAHNQASLEDRRESEKKEWPAIIARAILQREFLRSYTDAYYTRRGEVQISGAWVMDSAVPTTIEHSDGKFTAAWTAGAVKHRMTGTFTNSAAKIEIQKWEQPSLLLSILGSSKAEGHWGTAKKGYAFLNATGALCVTVLENPNEPSYQRLNRA